MGVKRKKTLKWIPNELIEKARHVASKKHMHENEVIRMALGIGLEILEKEKGLLEEVENLKRRVEALERTNAEGGKTGMRDPFIEKLVEGI